MALKAKALKSLSGPLGILSPEGFEGCSCVATLGCYFCYLKLLFSLPLATPEATLLFVVFSRYPSATLFYATHATLVGHHSFHYPFSHPFFGIFFATVGRPFFAALNYSRLA
jgi:hypothetical protein